MKTHRNCRVVTEGYELEVVECQACGLHLGIDATYLEQVDGIGLQCPGCNITLTISGFGEEDGDEQPFKRKEDGFRRP